MNLIQLLSNKEVEFLITLELIKNFEIVTFLTYKLGAYDEFTDTVIFSKLIKVYRHSNLTIIIINCIIFYRKFFWAIL